MNSTFPKQIIYAVLYAAILYGVGYGIFRASLSSPTCFDGRKNQSEEAIDCGGVCEPCALKQLRPIAASSVSLMPAPGDSLSAVFELSNPNTGYGALKIRYAITFYDASGAPLRSVERETFIYPAEIKTVAEVGVTLSLQDVSRAEISLSSPLWKEGASFAKPTVETRGISIEADASKQAITVRGLLVNATPLPLVKVGVGVLVKNALGLPIAVSKTVQSDLAAFEERAFSVFVPGVDTLVATNDLKLFIEAEVRK